MFSKNVLSELMCEPHKVYKSLHPCTTQCDCNASYSCLELVSNNQKGAFTRTHQDDKRRWIEHGRVDVWVCVGGPCACLPLHLHEHQAQAGVSYTCIALNEQHTRDCVGNHVMSISVCQWRGQKEQRLKLSPSKKEDQESVPTNCKLQVWNLLEMKKF